MTDPWGNQDGSAPPDTFDDARKALWWLAKGAFSLGASWEHAHALCQEREGVAVHDWIHALVHRIEGDHANAAYWYRRAGRPVATDPPMAEAKRIAASRDIG